MTLQTLYTAKACKGGNTTQGNPCKNLYFPCKGLQWGKIIIVPTGPIPGTIEFTGFNENKQVIWRDWRFQHWEQQDQFEKHWQRNPTKNYVYLLFRTILGTIEFTRFNENKQVIWQDWMFQYWEQQDRFKKDRQTNPMNQLFRKIPGTVNLWTSPNNKAKVNHNSPLWEIECFPNEIIRLINYF